ncbi:hypothetical protein [Sphingobacterium sp.]|uniref:hypothetical protein n=1 Tax=Sphingobacterium sp. TaxID=341027 RepID=UPI0028A94094|nr:hypothetical protein [Sphingobacterium sp.]
MTRELNKKPEANVETVESTFCDPNLTNYINSIVAYKFLYNDYLEDLNSGHAEIRVRAENYWQDNLANLEGNIKIAFQKMIACKSKFIDDALYIFENTIRDNKRINLYG